jgi:hypothetical protein
VRNAYDAGAGIHVAGDCIDGDHVRGFVVPRTVLPPVGGRHFIPRVVEDAVGGEAAHRDV